MTVFAKPVRRKIEAVGPISGKPTVAFSPNTGHPYYPNGNAHFFTNLIAGQTDYVDDSIAGKADFSYNTGTFGNHALGEGFEVVVNGNTDGGVIDFVNVDFDSVAVLIECSMTDSGSPSYTYMVGNTTATTQVLGPVNTFFCARPQGLYQIASGNNFCLPDLSDGQLHRVCIKLFRAADAGDRMVKVAVDGVMYVSDQQDYWFGLDAYYIGRNSNGNGETLTTTGVWIWQQPRFSADPLSDQAMIDLTTDPWPYLVTLD